MKRLVVYVSAMAVCTLVAAVTATVAPHGVNWGTTVLVLDVIVACVVAWRMRDVWMLGRE